MNNIYQISSIDVVNQLISDNKQIFVLYVLSSYPAAFNNVLKESLLNISKTESDFIFIYFKLSSLSDVSDSYKLINQTVSLYPRIVSYNKSYTESVYVNNIDSIELLEKFITVSKDTFCDKSNKLLSDKLKFLTKYINHFNYNFYSDLKQRKNSL